MPSQIYTQYRKKHCTKKNQVAKFDKFNDCFENLYYIAWITFITAISRHTDIPSNKLHVLWFQHNTFKYWSKRHILLIEQNNT